MIRLKDILHERNNLTGFVLTRQELIHIYKYRSYPSSKGFFND